MFRMFVAVANGADLTGSFSAMIFLGYSEAVDFSVLIGFPAALIIFLKLQ